MAVGKNKRMSKGKKGSKRKVGDPFLKKEWYEVKAPSMFQVRNICKTLVTKSAGTKLAADGLRGRVFEMNLADLNNDEDQSFRKIKLCCEDIQGKSCLTDFHGMSITRDKLCSIIRKWFTLIEAFVDVKTMDGYTLRIFVIGFTKAQKPEEGEHTTTTQVKTTCYARGSQIRAIRKKMVQIVQEEASKSLLRNLVKKFIPEMIGKEIEKQCKGIYPLKNVLIRKVKILKKPKLDVTRLMELHGEGTEDVGKKMLQQEAAEAQNLLSAQVS